MLEKSHNFVIADTADGGVELARHGCPKRQNLSDLYDGAFVPVTTRHNRCGGIPGLETAHADTDSCTRSSDDITFFTFWLLQLCALGFLCLVGSPGSEEKF